MCSEYNAGAAYSLTFIVYELMLLRVSQLLLLLHFRDVSLLSNTSLVSVKLSVCETVVEK